MVCPRCIMAVEQLLNELNLEYEEVSLGSARLTKPLSENELGTLEARLEDIGFQLLQDPDQAIVEEVKAFLIQQIHHREGPFAEKVSLLLQKKFHRDYSALSRLFSQIEGRTIEQFISEQRIEKVKELLSYQQYRIQEIADIVGYSSAAHLSSHFKQRTGQAPSQFNAERSGIPPLSDPSQ